MDRFITAEDRAIISRIIKLPLTSKARFVWGLRKDPGITREMMLPMLFVLAYIVLPIRVLPRWLPFSRQVDNLVMAVAGLWLFVKLTPPNLLETHLTQAEQ